jgi:hypothetical protein
MLKTFTLALAVALAGGCATSKVASDKATISKLASGDLACGTDKAEVVYYGLRGADVPASSPCFGEKAQALAVVECGGKRRAYWKYADGNWEARPGEVTAVDAEGIEISLGGADNESGSVAAAARCSR